MEDRDGDIPEEAMQLAKEGHKIAITTQKDAGISDETVFALYLQSFRQWSDHGIDEPSLHQTLEHFKDAVRNAIVMVALDTETGELLGTHALQPNKRKNYVYGCYLAISPKAKRTGIATRMIQYEVAYLRNTNYEYLKGITSSAAVWSVKWHLKNGYRIIGYYKSPEKTHSTYLFRKQLKPSLIWSGPFAPIAARACFIVSYTITWLCRTSTGELNLLGRMAKKVVMVFRSGEKL